MPAWYLALVAPVRRFFRRLVQRRPEYHVLHGQVTTAISGHFITAEK